MRQGIFDRTDGGLDGGTGIALSRHGCDGLTFKCNSVAMSFHVESGRAVAAARPHRTLAQEGTGQTGCCPMGSANQASVRPAWLEGKPLSLGTGCGHKLPLGVSLKAEVNQAQAIRVGLVTSNRRLDMLDVLVIWEVV
jgi:hypothetical protein